jgi:peptidoglycan/LPS O-acetylase OafA/YrhL
VSEFFGQPEYLHVLVNPVLTHALPVAAVGLLLALLFRSKGATKLALFLVLLTAAAAWPAIHYGHEGYDRVKSMGDDTGGDWLAVHRYRAEKAASLFYVTALIALGALAAGWKWQKTFAPLSWLALAFALAACVAALRIAYPGGKIRHHEFRHEPPPAAEVKAAHTNAGEN